MPVTKVLLVEDHPIFSKGLVSLINTQPLLNVVGEAINSSEALKLIRNAEPDVAIIDLNLGDEDGLELIKLIRSLTEDLKIIVLSMNDERFYAERSIKAGAMGYIMKDEAGDKVVEAIKTVVNGNVWLSESERTRLLDYMTKGNSIKSGDDWFASIRNLSDRQLQIFKLIGKGHGTREISEMLNISSKTVDAHKEHIKLKMHCNSSKELRQWAIEWITSKSS